MACPVNNKEFRLLTKYIGSKDAHRVFLAHGNTIPTIDTITDLKKIIGFKSVVFGNQLGRSKYILNKYNEKNNTSHRITSVKHTASSEKAKLVLNFMPNSISSIVPNGGNKVVVKSGEVSTETPKDYNDIFIAGNNQFIVHGEVFGSYEDAAAYASVQRNNKQGEGIGSMAEIPRTSVDGMLEHLEKNAKSEFTRMMAKRLREFNPTSKVSIMTTEQYADYINRHNDFNHTNLDPSRSVGMYFPHMDFIAIKESASERVLLHEIAHALSAPLLDSNNKLSKEFEAYFEQVKERLERDGVPMNHYGLTNSREFVSEILSNSRFIEMLQSQEAIVPSKHRSLWSEVMEFFKKIFKTNKDSMYAEALEKVITVMDTQYSINRVFVGQSSPLAMEEQSREIKKLRVVLNKTIDKIHHKSKILKGSSGKHDSDVSKTLEIIALKTSKKTKDYEYADAILYFLENIINEELMSYTNMIADVNENVVESLSSADVNKMANALILYTDILSEIRTVLADRTSNPELAPIFQQVQDQLKSFSAELNHIRDHVSNYSRNNAVKILTKVLNDNMTGSAEELFDDIGVDINAATLNLGNMANSPDQIMQAIYKLVVTASQNTFRKTLNVGKDLRDLQFAMEEAGFKDMSIFHEQHNDENTGLVISSLKWGEYYAEERKMHSDMVEAINKHKEKEAENVKHFNEILLNELNNAQLKAYKAIQDAFAKKYIDSEGNPAPPANVEFEKLMTNPAVKAYYDKYTQMMLESRDKLPKRYRNGNIHTLRLPQIRKDVLETLKSKDKVLQQLWSRAKEHIKINDEDTQYGSNINKTLFDETGIGAKLIPIHFSSFIENQADLSNDITSMAVAFYEMAESYDSKTDAVEEINVIKRTLETRKFTNGKENNRFDKSRIAKMLDNFVDAQIFNIKDTAVELTVSTNEDGTKNKINVTKILDQFLNFVRGNNLFMSMSILSGAVKARVDKLTDSIAQTYTSLESSLWADKEWHKNLPSVIHNIGKRNKTGKVMLLLEYNKLLGDNKGLFDKTNIHTKIGRTTSSDIIYGGFTVAEMGIKGKMALAVYDNYRLVDGKYITIRQFKRKYGDKASKTYDKTKKWSDFKKDSLYNAYEVKDNRFVVKKEYKDHVTEDLENEIMFVVDAMAAKLAGQLTTADKSNLGRGMIGKFLLLHKSWMVTGITERFKKDTKNQFTGEMEKGYYRSMGTFLKALYKEKNGMRAKAAVFKSLPDYEQQNVRKFTADFVMYLAFMALATVLQGFVDDDKDDYWKQFLSYGANRILLEQGAFFNSNDIISLFNSPTAASGTIKTIGDFRHIFTNWEEIEYGAYENMYQIEKAIIKNSLLKNIWEMRNAQSVGARNKYLTSQIL